MTIATIDEQGVTLLVDDEQSSFIELVSQLRKIGGDF